MLPVPADRWVRAADAPRSRGYLPGSPYRSPALVAAGNHNHLKPEDHLWGPRDDFKGRFYTQSPAHFASEIGYHGCPDVASLLRLASAVLSEISDEWETGKIHLNMEAQ